MKRRLLILMSVLLMMGTLLVGCSAEKKAQREAEKEAAKQAEIQAELEANAKYYNENMEEISEEEFQNTRKEWVAYYFDEDGTPLVGECTFNHCYITELGTIVEDYDWVYRLDTNTFTRKRDDADFPEQITVLPEDEVREAYRLIKNAEGKLEDSSEIKELVEYFDKLKYERAGYNADGTSIEKH